ncbi:MAG: hypothetical protein J4473_05775 [Candidatus Aenigmarchaeota archaeon]|nr:hypothetical protein [Candidatus Aenigmarchaeota archaeon]
MNESDDKKDNFSYKILNEDDKQVGISYKNKTIKFQLKVKRSFIVLKKLLEAYPDFINIHSLDNILHDPNRAHSDLRIANGFANFLIEKKDKKRVVHLKIDVEKLFRFFKSDDPDKFMTLSVPHLRKSLSYIDQDKIYEKFRGRCNITGIKVYNHLQGNYFFKHLLMASYDHRRPISKGGSNDLSNWQLVSKLANDEKNKICNICNGKKCEQCALAYPEKYNTIQPNNQKIDDIRVKN